MKKQMNIAVSDEIRRRIESIRKARKSRTGRKPSITEIVVEAINILYDMEK